VKPPAASIEGGRATAVRMASDPEADAAWRDKIGKATTARFVCPTFKALHAEACRRAAVARWARQRTP
jgi:hypothetical protein